MRIAYLDCSTGISGDMTVGALIDAGVDQIALIDAIRSLKLPDVDLVVSRVVKGGFAATKIDVQHPEQHAHRHLADIVAILDQSDSLTQSQRELSLRIFTVVAQAEATVHGMSLESVHFHEVGAVDSIVDIVAAAVGFDLLNVDQVVCSRIPTGFGQIKIDHGICTVPAPGTAELLKGIPLVDIPIEAELTTPTGAAIVKTLVTRFGRLPEMMIESIGYGAGTKDFPQRANLLRLIVGDAVADPNRDWISLLETNLDDVSGEIIGHTKQDLLTAGALDVYSTPIQMKKDRPGVCLSVICRPEDRENMEQIIFKEAKTLGIRHHLLERNKQSRRNHTVKTPWGDVAGKMIGGESVEPTFTPEFESCAELAKQTGRALHEVYRAAEAAFVATARSLVADSSSPAHTHDHDHATEHSHSDDHRHDHDHDDHHHDHG